MKHKLTILRTSLQQPLPGFGDPYVAMAFIEFNEQRVLKVAPGNTPEEAVDWLGGRIAEFCGLKRADVIAIVRPILLPCFNGGVVQDVGDVDDIPF